MQCVYSIQVVYKIKDFKGWKKPRIFLSDNIDSRIHRLKWRIRHSIYVVPFIAIFWTTGWSIYIIGTLSYIKILYFETVFSQFVHAQQSPSKPNSSWTYVSLNDLLLVGHAPFSTCSELNLFEINCLIMFKWLC